MNPSDPAVTAVFLRAHLRMAKMGMAARGVTKKELLEKAGKITGQTYKRGEYNRAITDLTAFIQESENEL